MKRYLKFFVYAGVFCLSSTTMAVAATPQQDQCLSHEALQRFGQSLEAVRQLYVDNVSDEEILEHAIKGMLTGLDPHSTYLDQADYKTLQQGAQGEFSGVGLQVTMRDGAIYVVTPLDDTPAYRAGIKPGDIIIRINGQSVRGMSLDQAVKLMRGKTGTSVKLTIVRAGQSKPLVKTVKRAKINVDSVKHKVIDQYYGYIRISSFGHKTSADVRLAVKSLFKETDDKLRGIVLDLRNNPGGLLDASVEVADVFLDANKIGYQQKVVSTKGRLKKSGMSGKANEPDLTNGVPIVAMVNQGSASAAEIVAGALQDHRRAVVLGVRSFGKGSVQTVLPLKDNKTALKLTTARYYTPSGRAIQAKGIEPDVVVEALNIPAKAKPEQNFMVRESALNGRLDAEQQAGDNKPQSQSETDDLKLMQDLLEKTTPADSKEAKKPLFDDYQLYRAVSLLKALYANNVK